MEFTIIVDQHERISQTDDGDAMGFSQEGRQEEIDAPRMTGKGVSLSCEADL